MKEIGEFLKSSRINNGVSLEEAAEDLNLSVGQLENIEDGNIRAFKDVFSLRELVKDYSKYLGVETDKVVDEFNDFMFEHTSKISLNDILEARKLVKEKEEEDKEKVISPYTNIPKKKVEIDIKKVKIVLMVLGCIALVLLLAFIISRFTNRDEGITSELKGRSMEEVYECTY